LAFPNRLSGLILRDTWAFGFRGTLNTLKNILASKRINPDPDRQVRVWSGSVQSLEDCEAAIAEILPIYRPEKDEADAEPVPFEGGGEGHVLRWETHNAAWSYSAQRFDVRARLGEIKVPTLVLVGRHDPICPPEYAEEIAQGVSGSELVVFEKSGHNPAADEPEAFQEVVANFLSRRV
jgi:proline iminopeptidase